MKNNDLALPPVVELAGLMGETDGRMILMHVRSLTCVEVGAPSDLKLKPGVITRRFEFKNFLGIMEPIVMAVHFCHGDPFPDADECEPFLDVLQEYYIKFAHEQDRNVQNEALGALN